jgi:hypothetical protein
MNRFHVKLMVAAATGSLLFSNSIAAQVSPYSPKILPPAVKAAHVRITKGPELESADDNSAIISWTSNNPGGSDEHYAVLHYGTNPKELNQTAKSHIPIQPLHYASRRNESPIAQSRWPRWAIRRSTGF